MPIPLSWHEPIDAMKIYGSGWYPYQKLSPSTVQYPFQTDAITRKKMMQIKNRLNGIPIIASLSKWEKFAGGP